MAQRGRSVELWHCTWGRRPVRGVGVQGGPPGKREERRKVLRTQSRDMLSGRAPQSRVLTVRLPCLAQRESRCGGACEH